MEPPKPTLATDHSLTGPRPGTFDEVIDRLGQRIADIGVPWSEDEFLQWARVSTAFTHPGVSSIGSLLDLPVVTSDTFRFADLTHLSRPAVRVFRTSGTSTAFRGENRVRRLDIYDVSLSVGFRLLIAGRRKRRLSRLLSVVPRESQLPDSSLSYMLERFIENEFEHSVCVVGKDGLDREALLGALEEAASAGEPTLLFATTSSAAAVLDSLRDLKNAPKLPEDSLILTTGGAKRAQGRLDGAAVDQEIGELLSGEVGSEYGMTELFSQAYRIGEGAFELPPWCAVLAIDPATGRETQGLGLLRFVDLANLQSAVSVQTADLGIAVDRQHFFYHSRAPGSVLRGCSVSFDELTEPDPGPGTPDA
ncbi:MAG: hypothetical protein KC561_03250 [Myxococcales bacterium]|nr:hypothetical protein [Myxococcales bacterium]